MLLKKIMNSKTIRPVPSPKATKNPLSGLIYCKKCGRSMVRRPYTKNGYDDTLICPYTSCSTVSSKLSLVEKAVIDGLSEIVKNYKLNNTLQDKDGTDIISSKETLLEQKQSELAKLQDQKEKQFDLLEQGIYSTEMFLERSNSISNKINECSAAIGQIRNEIEHDRKLLSQKNSYIPKCEHLLSNYWEWDAKTKNEVLKELIERVEYSKDTRNNFREGDKITFTLDIYPKIQ